MKTPYTFFLSIGCLTLVAVSGSLIAAPAATEASKPATETPVAAEEKKEGEEGQQMQVDENSVLGRMAKTVMGYYSAKSPRKKLEFVLNPEETEPLMRDFYFREGLNPGNVKEMTTPEAVAVDGIAYWRSRVVLTDGRQGTVFLKVVDDTPKVDWPSEVRYSAVNWDEWLNDDQDKAEDFRVWTQLDTYYPKDFSDRSKYICIKVSHADSPNTIFAYLKLSDPEQLEYAQSLTNGQMRDALLSLKLVKGEDQKFKLATVEKIVSPSWLNSKAGK